MLENKRKRRPRRVQEISLKFVGGFPMAKASDPQAKIIRNSTLINRSHIHIKKPNNTQQMPNPPDSV